LERGFGLPVAGMNTFTILTTENMGKICCVEAHCLVSGKKSQFTSLPAACIVFAFNVFTTRVIDVMATAMYGLYTNHATGLRVSHRCSGSYLAGAPIRITICIFVRIAFWGFMHAEW